MNAKRVSADLVKIEKRNRTASINLGWWDDNEINMICSGSHLTIISLPTKRLIKESSLIIHNILI